MEHGPPIFCDFFGDDGNHYLVTLTPPFTDKNLAVLFSVLFETMVKSGVPIRQMCPLGQVVITGGEKIKIAERDIEVSNHPNSECAHDPEEEPDTDAKIENWVLGQINEQLDPQKADFNG